MTANYGLKFGILTEILCLQNQYPVWDMMLSFKRLFDKVTDLYTRRKGMSQLSSIFLHLFGSVNSKLSPIFKSISLSPILFFLLTKKPPGLDIRKKAQLYSRDIFVSSTIHSKWKIISNSGDLRTNKVEYIPFQKTS